MAFADPQTIKVDGTNNVSLPRVDTGSFTSDYLSSDGLVEVKLSTTNGRRKRHQIRLNLKKIIASVLNPSQNEESSSSVYLVVDRPNSGYTNEELRKAVEGVCNFLTASEGAALKKLLGSES